MMKIRRYLLPLLLVAAVAAVFTGCDDDAPERRHRLTELSVWLHYGTEDERRTLQDQVTRFNENQRDVRVNAVILPDGRYHRQIRAAINDGSLPDIIELDARLLYEAIARNSLQPIDKYLTEGSRRDLLPNLLEQGMYHGRLYSVATTESGVAIYARRSLLQEAGIRIPTAIGDAWSRADFGAALAQLAARDADGRVLDLGLDRGADWLVRVLSTIIYSSGGDIVDRRNGTRSVGLLDADNVVASFAALQAWHRRGYLAQHGGADDLAAGRIALAWSDNGSYTRYLGAVGDDLVVIPLPDFGAGSRTSEDAWSWGITTRCRDTRSAMLFLEFLLRPDEVAEMADANGGIPALQSVMEESELYDSEGALKIFAEQITSAASITRPHTPAWPALSDALLTAYHRILAGTPAREALHTAALSIEEQVAGAAPASPRHE